MLVTTIEQVREVIGSSVRKENVLSILTPYLNETQEYLITELIGPQQLAALVPVVSGKMAQLKTLVIKAIIWNAYQDAWLHALYEMTGSGVKRQDVKDTAALFRYQEDAIQKDIVRKADEATERMMLFLETNLADFPLYKQSEEFVRNFSYLIPTPGALQRALPEVSKSYRMYSVLRGYMERTENATIRSIAGSALYYDLKSKVSSGELLNDSYKKLLLFTQDYVAPATLLEAMPWIRVQFSPAGIRILSVLNNLQDQTPVNDKQTEWLMGILKERMELTKTALRGFLNATASSTVFPDYFNSPLYRSPGTKQWTMPDNAGKKHFRM